MNSINETISLEEFVASVQNPRNSSSPQHHRKSYTNMTMHHLDTLQVSTVEGGISTPSSHGCVTGSLSPSSPDTHIDLKHSPGM